MLLQRIFGRKPGQPADSADMPAPPRRAFGGGAPSAQAMPACDAFLAKHDPEYPNYRELLKPGRWRDFRLSHYSVSRLTEAMTVTERSAILVSSVALNPDLSRYVNRPSSLEEVRISRLSLLARACEKLELEHSPEVFAALARLLSDSYDYRVSGKPLVQRIYLIFKDGYQPTRQEIEWLTNYRAILERCAGERSCLKGDVREMTRMQAILEKICGMERKKEDVVARRTVVPDRPPWFVRDEPESFTFWVEFMARAAEHFESLLDDVMNDRSPAWTHDRSVFETSFPPVGEHYHVFQGWLDPARVTAYGDYRSFAWIREKAQQVPMFYLHADEVRAIAQSQERMRSLVIHEWNRDWIPAADVLLGENSDVDRSLLELFVDNQDGPRPIKAWRKEAFAIASRIGHHNVADRLRRWLTGFQISDNYVRNTSLDLHRWHWLALGALTLQEECPFLPTVPPELLDRYAASFAFATLSTANAPSFNLRAIGMLKPSGMPECVFWRSGCYYPDQIREGKERPRELGIDQIVLATVPTIENEKVLRAACWLLADYPDAASVETLELTARAATLRALSDQFRSRGTANAAIASLGTIGTAEALHALGRLRRAIRDKAIGNSIEKAMTAVAGKLDVTVDDVAEMSVPDYGLS